MRDTDDLIGHGDYQIISLLEFDVLLVVSPFILRTLVSTSQNPKEA